MKVLCIRVPAPIDGMQLDSSPWITLHREYVVASVGAQAPGRVQLQLVNDTGSLGWFDANCFLTVDSAIPENWSARVVEGGALELAPQAWLASGFWEKYYDGDPDARESVDQELTVMSAAAGSDK
ncbi:hypothetical protein [Aeromicrobium sp. CF3.5]|uniref:hypothetical protein n=1 Tax=Aeromicrobium sp. CF3.5 TaxID=3373078 RepID=UPI003EE5789D